jgi:hypothetical protein
MEPFWRYESYMVSAKRKNILFNLKACGYESLPRLARRQAAMALVWWSTDF